MAKYNTSLRFYGEKKEFGNPRNAFKGFKWDPPIMFGHLIIFLPKPPLMNPLSFRIIIFIFISI
jgi:hypothetical protein